MGKVGPALKFLDDNAEHSVLKSSSAVVEKLKQLHPQPSEVLPDSLIQGPVERVSPAVFNSITEEEIMKAASKVQGSGGPSLMDAKQWRRILCSAHYKKEGSNLREEMAQFAKKISLQILDPNLLEAYTANRLIPLDKAPGEEELQVRPIGVGEVFRRIVGKTISWALNEDIQEAGGPLQVATGLKAGGEAAIHAMKDIFDAESSDAIILVDAENAFNKLNRRVALHNIQYTCPNFAVVLINTYRKPSRLFIVGGGEILSMEGTTQGDTLAMAFYGISTKPLIMELNHSKTNVWQVWLADDATGAGSLTDLKSWWDLISKEGSKYGYIVKPSKSWLILKDPAKEQEAKTVFAECQINVTTAGKRHLGAALGTTDFKDVYINLKVTEWCKRISKLSAIAKSQPQAAYSAFILGEQHRYTHFIRTIHNIAPNLKPLDDAINNEFIPALFGSNISSNDRDILSLKIKDGGLGLRIFSNTANQSYDTSRKITKPLVTQIKMQSQSLPCPTEVAQAKNNCNTALNIIEKERRMHIVGKQTPELTRTVDQLAEPGTSSWLSAKPLKDEGFNLTRSEFVDAIRLRYDMTLHNLPSKCPCDKKFTVNHAMNCHRGGFINARHDSIRNFEAHMLKKVCNDVQVEPPLQPVVGMSFHPSANVKDEARLDVRAKGFWREGQNAFFDVKITNAEAEYQRHRTVKAVLKSSETAKKTSYNVRVMEVEHGTFTPIILTVKGVMGPEATRYHKTLASKIADKTGECYNDVTRIIRVKMSYLILKASLMCLRGSRTIYSKKGEECDDFAHSINELGLH